MDILEHLNKQIVADKFPSCKTTLIVAVSGGVDSVVLLHLLLPLAANFDWELIVAHLDHKLRKESDSDLKFVANLSSQLDLEFVSKKVDIKKLANTKKKTIEEAGRDARYDFFDELSNKYKKCIIVTAHTADDQLETIVMNWVRGASLRGLTGMKIKEKKLWRPLLGIKKVDLISFAKKYKLKFREDKSNKNFYYTRNKVRHILLPKLKQLNTGFDKTILRNAGILADLENFIDQQVKSAVIKIKLKNNKNSISFQMKPFLQLHNFIQNEVLLYIIELIKGDRQDIKKIHLDEMYKVINSCKPKSYKQLPSKLLLTKAYDTITISCLRT